VDNDHFDGDKGVRSGDTYIPLDEDVQVYASSVERFITLSAARSNFSRFSVYLDRPLSEGGVGVVILAGD